MYRQRSLLINPAMDFVILAARNIHNTQDKDVTEKTISETVVVVVCVYTCFQAELCTVFSVNDSGNDHVGVYLCSVVQWVIGQGSFRLNKKQKQTKNCCCNPFDTADARSRLL